MKDIFILISLALLGLVFAIMAAFLFSGIKI